MERERSTDRRTLLAAAGLALSGGLAGCIAGAGDDGGTPTDDGSPDGDGTPDPGSGDDHGGTETTAQFQYGSENAGVAPGSAPTSADVQWERRLSPVDGGVAVSDDRVVVTTGGDLAALDRADGKKLWDRGVGLDLDAPPAIADGTAHVTAWNGGSQQDRGVVAVDLESGEKLWRAIPGVDISGAPTVTGDAVYVGGSLNSEEVIAIDRDGGEVRWRFEAGQYATTPAVVDGGVYAGGGSEPVVYALDAADGEELWRVEVGDEVWGAPTVVEETVYAGTRGGQVLALATASGEVAWREQVGSDLRESVAATDDRVYVPTRDSLVALDSGGGEQWSVDLGSRVSAPTIADDAVVVTDSRRACCLGADEGIQRWQFGVPERQQSDMVFAGIRSPPVVADGTAYVASHGGDVFALGAE